MRATAKEPGQRFTASATLVALAACALFLSILLPTAASAAPPQLWQACETGSSAGECAQPRGVAADPENGHVFIADNVNSRVVELDPLGEFVKAWGWDVVASGSDNTGTGFEVCVAESDVCKEGATGSEPGQFNFGVMGVALDSAGNVYVVDRNNHRVQKFSPAGQFLLMFGKGVNSGTSGNPEICTSAGPPTDICGTGTEGTGNGQFGEWAVGSFVAIDPTDRVYVGDQNRIQRFDTGGAYQDQCSVPGTVQSLATDSSGNLYAIYNNQLGVRKLAYVAGGACQELERFEIPEPDPVTHPRPTAVAVDAAGHVYAFSDSATGNGFVPLNRIFEFDPAGNVVDEFGKEEFDASTGLATNLCPGSEAPGNLYVSNSNAANSFVRAYGSEPIGCFKARTLPATNVAETSATLNGTVNPGGALSSECRFEYGTTTAYGHTAACAETPAEIGSGEAPVPVHADVSSLEAATVYHFRLRAKINGETETGPDLTFKTTGPPLISDEHVLAATFTEATLKALVNPEGFPTSCHFEYGTTATLYGQSSSFQALGSDRTDHVLAATLQGLTPATPYHWRVLCSNTAALNGGIAAGEDRTLATYGVFSPQPDCPNQAFRGAASAALPDCRAYEMVSPVDKNGADIIAGTSATNVDGGSMGYVQASPDGERLAYAALLPAFGEDLANSFNYNQYLATRHERGQPGAGWSSQGLHPPYLGHRIPGVVPGAFREFIAFTPDLCSAWLVDYQTPALNPGGQDEAANLYRRQSCGEGAGSFETLTTAPLSLTGEDRSKYVDPTSVQGVSADSRHAVFLAKAPLTADAAAGTNAQIYDRFGGALHLVSVLPGGVAEAGGAEVGSGWSRNLQGAVSEDGSYVYWTSGGGEVGKIYRRRHPEQGIVAGECNNTGTKACTIPVSSGSNALFWAASPHGATALYSEGNSGAATLYEFDSGSGASQVIAQNVRGVAGASADLSRVYFVSDKALPGSGTNSPEEDEAVEGEPNLYLAAGGGFSFVATLAEGDVGAVEPGAPVTAYRVDDKGTFRRATRVTPDGSRIAFESRAPLTGFDNAAEGGKPAVEVYTYQVGGDLLCVSCNPSGARPAARELPEPYKTLTISRKTKVLAAAWIPAPEHPLHASNLLSDDGQRLFFNANDALLPRDTNGAPDVYEWEAPGAGGCTTESPDYFAPNGGCLYLISSGESSFESEFWEASPDGHDVFFTTESSLLPQDPGSVDLYDARVEGGFPQPEEKAACEGEACQSPPAPPASPSLATVAHHGPGNPPHARKPCRKPKVRRHGRCVAKKHRHAHKHHHNRNRRAPR